MNVRPAENRDEAWLLDKLEELDIQDTGFRSRDYVIAYSPKTDDPCGVGRVRYHNLDNETVCELDNLVVFPDYQGQSPLPAIVRELASMANDEGISTVYHPSPPQELDALGGDNCSGERFGIDKEVLVFDVDTLRNTEGSAENLDELADEFGYDEETSTKYSID